MAIPLSDGFYGFCRALTFPNAEFFDYRASDIPPVDIIVSKPVMFRICVMKYAFTGRRWTRVGTAPLRADETGKRWFYFKQSEDGRLFKTRDGMEEVPSTWEEAQGLECAAGWDPEHVEDRLRDHFANRPNKWVESLRPKPIQQ